MKLLFLAHRIPFPPNKGDKIRSYHELRAFAERGHEVHLLAFADDVRDLTCQMDLAHLCASVQIVPLHRLAARLRAMTRIFVRQPLSLGFYSSPQMRKLVRQSIAGHNFDAVMVYSSTMAQYVPKGLLNRAVVDLVDVDSEKWRDYAVRTRGARSLVYGLEWKRLRRYEHDIVSRFAYTVLTTQREAVLLDQLDEFTRRARLRIITNGVDLGFFEPRDGQIRTFPPRLVFVGAMDYYANIDGVRWFVEEVLPLIREDEPGVEFFIVGSNPTREVERLAGHEGVTVTGAVEDVRPYLHSADACVVPLRIARGVQNKVLEAMAAGKAIIASEASVAGLRVEDGEHLLIARSPQEFADATLKVVRDDDLREHLGLRASYFVESEHDWEPLLQRLVELVESVSARNSRQHEARGRRQEAVGND